MKFRQRQPEAAGQQPARYEKKSRPNASALVATSAAVLVAAACTATSTSSAPSPEQAPRPSGLHYVSLKDWRIDLNARLSPQKGAVYVEGDASVSGEPQSAWDKAVLLGVSRAAVNAAVGDSDKVLLAYTGPGGDVHFGDVDKDLVAKLATDPKEPKEDVIAPLLGPAGAYFAVAKQSPDGRIDVLPTELVVAEPLSLSTLAREYPHTATLASSNPANSNPSPSPECRSKLLPILT